MAFFGTVHIFCLEISIQPKSLPSSFFFMSENVISLNSPLLGLEQVFHL